MSDAPKQGIGGAIVGIVIIGLMVFMLGCALGDTIGECRTTRTIHDEAVKAGHAEYYLDKDNEKQWRWKM